MKNEIHPTDIYPSADAYPGNLSVEEPFGLSPQEEEDSFRPWGNPEAEPTEQAVYGPLHDLTQSEWTEAQRLAETRRELGEIEQTHITDELPPTIIEGLPAKGDERGGQEMLLQKKAKRQKEKAPRQFSDMLVVFNDVQLFSEADQEALGAFLQYVEANKGRITHLVANGDIADFTAQSGFDKDLGQLNSTNDEIESVRWLIDRLSGLLPNAKKVFIAGNHEARWDNLIEAEKGNEAWIKTMDEQFGLTDNGWEQIGYGSGQFYQWHERIFWHGHRSGAVSNIPKLELQDAGVSVTTAHVNRNMFHESVDALGNRKSGITHGGFSRDNLGFMKKAATGWAQGFGVYFYDEKTKTETPYLVTMAHRSPRFIGPDGNVYDGTGFEIPGFEKPRGRGRPRKS